MILCKIDGWLADPTTTGLSWDIAHMFGRGDICQELTMQLTLAVGDFSRWRRAVGTVLEPGHVCKEVRFREDLGILHRLENLVVMSYGRPEIKVRSYDGGEEIFPTELEGMVRVVLKNQGNPLGKVSDVTMMGDMQRRHHIGIP